MIMTMIIIIMHIVIHYHYDNMILCIMIIMII